MYVLRLQKIRIIIQDDKPKTIQTIIHAPRDCLKYVQVWFRSCSYQAHLLALKYAYYQLTFPQHE